MQMFIPSVISALKALLKGPMWLLQKAISIFLSRRKSSPPPRSSPALISPSDSPYKSVHSQHQKSYERTELQQQTSTYHLYPPPRRVTEYSQSSSAHQLSVHRSQSAHQSPSVHQSPSQHTPHQPHRQTSVRLPPQPTPLIFPDVAPVNEPSQSDIPQRPRRISRPGLITRAPEVAVTPVVIDPYEDADSLRDKARIEGDRMRECLNKSREAFANNDGRLAKELSLKRKAYKKNMMCLNEAASARIFEENNQEYGSDKIDLHRLRVSEAKLHFDKAVQMIRNNGESSLCVIVGRGKHSEYNIPRIKPEIRKHGRRLGLIVEEDPFNDGRLIVSL
ncbi:uncharacterized protein EDB93DRAFT_473631 [Suillus bovinus]|uniref:uncharacterized protein n=1 Tax=Suillus bovinus TaxID=48563 RepID=UPI001B87C421|nr:uncharacterized protein EDB93DRAFT_473631 [Suillus bovinus]KAG2146396.1 hypothetical protein EDB93DRAFT_473631 [Suillus bovinus]